MITKIWKIYLFITLTLFTKCSTNNKQLTETPLALKSTVKIENTIKYVEDYGAIPNDNMDDTKAFSQALKENTQIKFRNEGIFDVDVFFVPDYISLIQGNGLGTIIRHRKSINGSLFQQANSKKRNSGLTVENISFRGNGEKAEGHVMDLTGFSYCFFNNITVSFGGLDNIFCKGNSAQNRQTSNLTFVNLNSYNAGRHGFNLAKAGDEDNTSISISGGNIADNGQDGIHIETGSSIVVKGVSVQGNHRHEIYNDGRFNLFEGVWVEKNSQNSPYHIPMILSKNGEGNKYSTIRSSLTTELTYRDVSGNANDYEVPTRSKNKIIDTDFTDSFPSTIQYNNYSTPKPSFVSDKNASKGKALEIKINDYAELDIYLTKYGSRLKGKDITMFLTYRLENIAAENIEARLYGMTSKNVYGTGIASWKWFPVNHTRYSTECFQVKMPNTYQDGQPLFLRFYASYPNKNFNFDGVQKNDGTKGKLLIEKIVVYDGIVTKQ
jgi:hypothetical protein